MRLVVARCTVDYEGRLTAHLPLATRLVMVKADGCVAVHADGGAYKPLNWMNAPNRLLEEEGRWIVSNSKGEKLTITFEEVLWEVREDMGEDPGLQKDGVEAELQRLLAERIDVLGEGMELIQREYPTPVGPVDLLCRDRDGTVVAVEVKRKGGIDGVEQLTRYLDFLARRFDDLRGMLVATIIAPQARALAEDRNITCREVDYDELRGSPSNLLKLF